MDERRAAELGERVRAVAWEVSESLGATTEAVARTVQVAEGG
jgi:IclR family acetate operon transcriptional repressor